MAGRWVLFMNKLKLFHKHLTPHPYTGQRDLFDLGLKMVARSPFLGSFSPEDLIQEKWLQWIGPTEPTPISLLYFHRLVFLIVLPTYYFTGKMPLHPMSTK